MTIHLNSILNLTWVKDQNRRNNSIKNKILRDIIFCDSNHIINFDSLEKLGHRNNIKMQQTKKLFFSQLSSTIEYLHDALTNSFVSYITALLMYFMLCSTALYLHTVCFCKFFVALIFVIVAMIRVLRVINVS